MNRTYQQLSAEERGVVMAMKVQIRRQLSQKGIC